MIDVQTAVGSVFNGNTALKNMPRFDMVLPMRLDRVHQDALKNECQIAFRDLAHSVDKIGLTDDKRATALIIKIANHMEDSKRSASTEMPSINAMRAEFYNALLAKPEVLDGKQSVLDIVTDYITEVEKNSEVQITEAMKPEDFKRLCENPYATLYITECSNDWLNEHMPPHIKADLVTYAETPITLTQVQASADIQAPDSAHLKLPALTQAHSLISDHIDAPELLLSKGQIQAQTVNMPSLEWVTKLYVFDDQTEEGEPSVINLPSLQGAGYMSLGGADISAPSLEQLDRADIQSAANVDFQSLIKIEGRGLNFSDPEDIETLTLAPRACELNISMNGTPLTPYAAQNGWKNKPNENGSITLIAPEEPSQKRGWTPVIVGADHLDM